MYNTYKEWQQVQINTDYSKVIVIVLCLSLGWVTPGYAWVGQFLKALSWGNAVHKYGVRIPKKLQHALQADDSFSKQEAGLRLALQVSPGGQAGNLIVKAARSYVYRGQAHVIDHQTLRDWNYALKPQIEDSIKDIDRSLDRAQRHGSSKYKTRVVEEQVELAKLIKQTLGLESKRYHSGLKPVSDSGLMTAAMSRLSLSADEDEGYDDCFEKCFGGPTANNDDCRRKCAE